MLLAACRLLAGRQAGTLGAGPTYLPFGTPTESQRKENPR
jgi:hypothetical protein